MSKKDKENFYKNLLKEDNALYHSQNTFYSLASDITKDIDISKMTGNDDESDTKEGD